MNDETSANPPVGWRNLREFRSVDLEASFVLSWSYAGETLELEVDLVLLENHPLYEKPRPSQTHCMRAAVIEFPVVDALILNGETVGDAPSDRLFSTLKPGLLRSMVVSGEGSYVLAGDFGTVAFQSERPVLRILSH